MSRWSFRSRTARSLLASAAAFLLVATLAPPASAAAETDPVTHTGVVSADPANFTPHVQDGDVRAIVQIGGRVVVGGNFTTVRLPGGVDVPRTNVFAFDATTGALDEGFVPAVDGEVSALLPGTDGTSVYLGGSFATVNGEASKSLARLSLANGQKVAGFTVPRLDGVVKDLKLVGGRLLIGGVFKRVAGTVLNRTGLADLDPDSGALGDFMNIQLTGTHQAGDVNTGVWKMDVTPDGSRMVVIGNFDQADGAKREQFAMLDLSGATATVADYYTPRYEPDCSASFDSYMRDVAFAPDGSYFVIVTTGAYFADTLCDSAARFETGASGTGIQPSWVNNTGGDTLSAVTISGPVVYIGGHQRWLNNPFCADQACQGAVDRAGIAALNPVNGTPYSWNPGRARGVAVYDLTLTQAGLWVGSDTELIGGETHRRLAFLPVDGGSTLPSEAVGRLPGDVYTAGGHGTEPENRLQVRGFDGTTAGPVEDLDTGGFDWRTTRGAFMLGDTLYHGSADGELYRRSFDGAAPGEATKVSTADQLAPMTDWHTQLAAVTGMFYSDGRIYYVRGTSALNYRYFNPESGIVGAQEFRASDDLPGLSWASTGGMFVHDGTLYSVDDQSGRLLATEFTGGQPVASTTVVADEGDWRGHAVFLNAGAPRTSPIAFRATAGFNANTLRAVVTVPSEVQPGDGMLLFGTTNNPAATVTPPDGWTQLASASTGGADSYVWQRVATEADPGSEVALSASAFSKIDLRLIAYDGTDATGPVEDAASFVDPALTTAHRTPPADLAEPRWVVSYWADKSSSTTSWTSPGGVVVRSTAIGTGTGRITSLLADSGRGVAAGTAGGLTATTDLTSRGLMWTVVLAPE